jgi:hypothetical protein
MTIRIAIGSRHSTIIVQPEQREGGVSLGRYLTNRVEHSPPTTNRLTHYLRRRIWPSTTRSGILMLALSDIEVINCAILCPVAKQTHLKNFCDEHHPLVPDVTLPLSLPLRTV